MVTSCLHVKPLSSVSTDDLHKMEKTNEAKSCSSHCFPAVIQWNNEWNSSNHNLHVDCWEWLIWCKQDCWHT